MRPSAYADDNLFLFEGCLYQHAELSELTSLYIYLCPSVHRIYFNLKKLNLKKKGRNALMDSILNTQNSI